MKQNKKPYAIIRKLNKGNVLPSASILISAILLAGAFGYAAGLKHNRNSVPVQQKAQESVVTDTLEEAVLPSEGVVLPVKWGNLGAQLVDTGVIDAGKFRAIYDARGGFTDEYEALLSGQRNGNLKITEANAGYLLNLLWAFGLANKNQILESGEMADPKYGGPGRFASTGGWTMAQGDAMEHYSRHTFVTLTPKQQELAETISRGIYRPCCGNSAHFPDCNHGMAMLGLLELMASQGVSEQDMWEAALVANSYWFPDTYLTIATYLKDNGTDWKDANPKEILGANYSSRSGYARISAQVIQPQQRRSGSGCGVTSGEPAAPRRQSSGCGV